MSETNVVSTLNRRRFTHCVTDICWNLCKEISYGCTFDREIWRGCSWAGSERWFYDTNFRHMRQQHFDNRFFATTLCELLIRAQQFGQSPKGAQFSSIGTSHHLYPKGYCRKWHKGVECLGCSFKHQRHKCGVTHPSSKFKEQLCGLHHQ